YAMEAEGNLEKAFQYYSQAANLHSSQKIIVALDRRWRGKSISDVASGNAKAVRHRLETEESAEDKVARLNLQGVSALNHNDPKSARQYFREAYKLDPENAFTLNNMGYIAELEGDQETAQDFYEQARVASGAARRATLTTRHEMQGLPLGQIARSNDEGSQANLETLREARLRQGGPIELKTRDNRPVIEPPAPPKSKTGFPQCFQICLRALIVAASNLSQGQALHFMARCQCGPPGRAGCHSCLLVKILSRLLVAF